MLVEKNSPLRDLSHSISPAQAGFIDGIRLSAEIFDLALSRLESTLLGLSENGLPSNIDEAHVASAFADAWTAVDAMNRIRELIRQMPGLKQDANHRLVLTRTVEIKRLRDFAQHLNNEIPKLSEAGRSTWGELRWIAMPRPETHKAKACVLIGGRINTGDHMVPNPTGRTLRCPIDQVSLTLGGHHAMLADCRAAIVTVVEGLETSLSRYPILGPTMGADLLFVAEIEFLAADPPEDDSAPGD